MRITCSYLGTQKIWETSEPEVFFGRAQDAPVALNLAPDQAVSRLHGRIWEEDDTCWIEDLNSSHGTQLNGIEIKGRGKLQLRADDSILVGRTTLSVGFNSLQETRKTIFLEQGSFLLSERRQDGSGAVLAKDVVPAEFESGTPDGIEDAVAKRLRIVCELPFHFAVHPNLKSLLPAILDELVRVIPTGETWALVLREHETDSLVLKAYHFADRLHVGTTLLRRAMTEGKAFVWKQNAPADGSRSSTQGDILTAMYAPLHWRGESLGAICTATRSNTNSFTDEDLTMLILVSQYAAMAVATLRLQEKIRRESVIKANLLRQFSPKVADQLLSHRGQLRLGGRRSEVTILNSDIRGFSQLAKEMDSDEIVEMLNEYLGALVPVIFAHRGTIDKFMGDAVLAIFGSPESDPMQHENAVRAALEMLTAVNRVNQTRKLRGASCCDFGLGVHCGEVVHGFVGSTDRMEFTVIGDAVNRTQRYCAAAAGREILISPELFEHVESLVETELTSIQTKHEGDLVAHRVLKLQEGMETLDLRAAD